MLILLFLHKAPENLKWETLLSAYEKLWLFKYELCMHNSMHVYGALNLLTVVSGSWCGSWC